MAERGDDLSQSRDMEFAHLFDDQAAAFAFRDWARLRGYRAEVWEDDAGASTSSCARRWSPSWIL